MRAKNKDYSEEQVKVTLHGGKKKEEEERKR